MEIFRTHRRNKDLELIIEEKFYEYVAQEIEVGNIRQGLWAKATSEADTSSEPDIKKKYIKLRVEFLKAEGRLYEQLLKELLAEEASNQSHPNKVKTAQPNPAEHFTDSEVVTLIVVALFIIMMVVAFLGGFS